VDVLLVTELPIRTAEVCVVYTTPEGTESALSAANLLSKDLKIKVCVLALQVVPYALDIDEPPVSPGFMVHQILTDLKRTSPHSEFTLQYALCRDYDLALAQFLKEPSIVVIGGRRGVIPSHEQRIARKLEQAGHQVLFVPTKECSHKAPWMDRCRDYANRWLTAIKQRTEHSLEGK